jgi:hypothetical protein
MCTYRNSHAEPPGLAAVGRFCVLYSSPCIGYISVIYPESPDTSQPLWQSYVFKDKALNTFCESFPDL